MNAISQAFKAAVKVPTDMERIFNYLVDHPKRDAVTVGLALKIKPSSVSSMLSQMETRLMVTSELISRKLSNKSVRQIKHFSVAIKKYELLPLPKKDAKPAKKFANTVTELPVAATVLPKDKFVTLNAAIDSKLDEMLENLTIRDARAMYEKLHKLFN